MKNLSADQERYIRNYICELIITNNPWYEDNIGKYNDLYNAVEK